MTSLYIERLIEADRETVRRLLIESYQQYEKEFTDKEVWKDYIEHISSSIDNPDIDRILVAKQKEEPVGTLQLFQNAEAAYGRPELDIHAPIVRLLAVHPKARGQGAAKALLKESLLYAKSLGADHLYLHSGDIMQRAIQLYEWLGFKRDFSKEFCNGDVHVKCFRYDLTERSEWLEPENARKRSYPNPPPSSPISGIITGGI